MKNIRVFTILISIGLFLVNCVNDKYDITKIKNNKLVFDPMIGLPLLYTSQMTADQILMRYLGKNNVGTYDDKLVYMRYAANDIPPIVADSILTLHSPIPISPVKIISFSDPDWKYNTASDISSIIIDTFYTFPFPSGMIIDTIAFNTLVYNINEISSSYPVKGSENTLTIEFPGMRKKNASLWVQVPITSNHRSFNNKYPLQGFALSLSGHQFHVKYILSLSGPKPSSGALTINHSFGDINSKTIDYNYVWGYLGNGIIYKNNASIPITLFSNVDGIKFEDPKIILSVKNSFGFPISLTLNNISATTSSESIPMIITGYKDSIIWLQHPVWMTDTVAFTPMTFNSENSNFKNALNAQPSRINCTLTARSHPEGNILGARHFMKSNSRADINLEVHLPLWGNCLRFGVNDIFSFDYGGLETTATGIEFKVWVSNGLQVGGKFTMVFCDKDTNEIDRISNDIEIIDPALVDPYDMIISNTEKDFTLKYYRLDKLPDIKFCKIMRDFHTPYINGKDASGGVKTVKVKSDNTMQIKIGMKIKYAFTISGQ